MSGLMVIAGISIRDDGRGRYCLNDFHKAAVAAGHDYKRCQVEHFTRNDATAALVDEMRKSGELEIDPLSSKPGRYGGTYAVKELVYAYAMWISAAFQLKVIRAYDAMVSGLVSSQVGRIEGKQTRRELTDTIKDFVSYAKSQGSQSAEKYYMSITKMEYAALGMLEAKEKGFRDTLNISQVHTLAVAEHIAREAILQGMEEGMFYKDIYKFAKQAVERYAATLPHNRRLGQ